VSDRDLVLEVITAGKDPAIVKLIELVHGQAVIIGADDSVEEAIRTTSEHKVRRLPVIDGTALVGMVSQADIARSCPPEEVGKLVAAFRRIDGPCEQSPGTGNATSADEHLRI
jgi:predicted transcriptional regulator